MELDRERTLFRRLVEVLALPEAEREDAARRTPGLARPEAERLVELVRRDAGEPALPAPARLVRTLEPGERLDDYRLLRKLGEGGMGQVWEAEQLSLGRRVALKLLRSGLLGDPVAVTRLRQEAETAARLAHPGIITVHAVGATDGLPWIAQELVAGGRDLRAWIQEQRRAGAAPDHAQVVARLMADVADAVQAAHAAGVVHRDIKPHNLMLRADGRPVVLDFGLAGLSRGGSGELTARLIGTAAYLAPEQVRADSVGKDPRTDVYQLGATLYELLTLHRAFADAETATITRRILAGDFERPRVLAPRLPYALEAICLKAMALQAADRYPDAGALRDDLRRYLDGRELPHVARGGRAAGALRRVPFLVRRHRLALGAAAAIILGLLAGWLAFGGEPAGASVRALRRTADGARPVAWADSDEAGLGDTLGVELELPRPATVYALSAFGERAPPTWVMPVVPVERETLLARDGAPPAATAWGLPLPAGRHELLLSQLGDASGRVGWEGFVLLVAEQPSPALESWSDALQRAAEQSVSAAEAGQPGVAYEQACCLFAEAGATRGQAPQLGAGELAGLARLSAADVLAGERFSAPGVECWRVMWRVKP